MRTRSVEFDLSASDWLPGGKADGGGLLGYPFAVEIGVELAGHEFVARLVLDLLEDDVIGPSSVSLNSEDGQAITGTLLRSLQVGRLVKLALMFVEPMTVVDDETGATRNLLFLDPQGIGARVEPDSKERFYLKKEERERLRQQGPLEETLREVARLYNNGQLRGDPPAQQVAIGLDVPRPTASRWIRRAREKGLISPKPYAASDTGGQDA